MEEQITKGFENEYDEDKDEAYYVRSFSGRLTKRRYKLLDRICRSRTEKFRCHCEHDCCGCLVYTDASFTYKHNLVTIKIRFGLNY